MMIKLRKVFRWQRCVIPLLLIAGCGHYGVDLGPSETVDAASTGMSDATSNAESKSDGQTVESTETSGSRSDHSEETKPRPDTTSISSTEERSSNTSPITRDTGDAGEPGDAAIPISDAAAADADVPDASLGAGDSGVDSGLDAGLGSSSTPSTETGRTDGGRPDAGEICDPECECTLGSCHLACLTTECLAVCATECRLDVGDAEAVTVECKPGAVCKIEESDAPVVAVTCKGGGDCRTECRDGQQCSMTCEGQSRCSVGCKEGARCDVTCAADAQCQLVYEVLGDSSLTCSSGEVKACDGDYLTCGTECSR